MKRSQLFPALFVAILLSVACQKTDPNFGISPFEGSALVVSLKDIAPFPVGVSVGYNYLKDNAGYQKVVREEMSSVSVENAQKWSGLHPEINRFDFTKADFIVDWAIQNKKRVHGHNLLWHSYNPTWVKNFEGDSTAWENLMKTHIQTVVTHFKGKVLAWDVVNEAFTDGGRLRNTEPKAEDSSIWRQKLGPDYLARAFRYAHEADPACLLFYNEYGQESKPAKIKATLELVADFRKRGIPIHGLGLQFHIGISQANAGIQDAIQQFAATGLQVHISELDILVSDWKKDPTLQYTEAMQQKHADKYKFVAETYKKLVPKNQQYGITIWNVGDADSWITKMGYTDWPLLFDKDYNRKKSYYGFAEGLK
jgi:endo-1,4-beta-xylanase